MENSEKYFVDVYKQAAYKVKDDVTKYAENSLETFPFHDPLRKETIRFVIEGGKRFRPALAYLIAKYCGVDDMVPCLALEYFHKYLLTHDDIIDRDYTRYSAPTVHAKLEELFEGDLDEMVNRAEHFGKSEGHDDRVHFGNSLATVSGDLMCGDTYKIILDSEISDPRKIDLCRLVSVATEEVVYGWYIQFLMDYMKLGDSKLSEARIIESLIWVTGKYTMKFPMYFGFRLAGMDIPEGIDQLADDLGVLFQTGDDVIGIFGDTEETGKSNYGDIVQGKKTLPMWFSYSLAEESDKRKLEELVGKKDLTQNEVAEVREIVKRSGGLEKTKDFMREYRDRCIEQVKAITLPSDLKDFLIGFAIFLEKRTM